MSSLPLPLSFPGKLLSPLSAAPRLTLADTDEFSAPDRPLFQECMERITKVSSGLLTSPLYSCTFSWSSEERVADSPSSSSLLPLFQGRWDKQEPQTDGRKKKERKTNIKHSHEPDYGLKCQRPRKGGRTERTPSLQPPLLKEEPHLQFAPETKSLN